MLAQRLLVVIFLVPIGVYIISTGGWLMAGAAALVLGYGAWEYWHLFKQGGYHPSAPVLILGVAALTLARQFLQFTGSDFILGLLILLAMAVQIFHFENGDTTSAVDFNITLGGILYMGWLGPYLLSLRNLPDGEWWFLIALPAIWFGDGAAYFVGSHFGKHKMSRRVSPNKSWEGYVASIIAGTLGAGLLAALWHLRAPAVTPMRGLILGLVITLFSPLGDLGESMLKRGFGVKDSSHLLPGHGGIMDRIDSWLWAALIGYYFILYVWIR
jgi:phosphatidate cytidylyltransferase